MNWPQKPKKVAYVVLKGRTPGIYDNWPEAQAQVDGFEGAVFKGYTTYEDAVEVWDAWEESGENKIRPAKKNPGRRFKVTPEPPRRVDAVLKEYARRLVRDHSDGKGFGSHVTTTNT